MRLLAALVAPIVAAEGEALPRERFGKAIEEVATRYPGLLAGVAPGRRRLRSIPSRWSSARSRCPKAAPTTSHDALGALVDYLEFELKNHPGVANADAVLHAVAPLRATLRG